MDGMPRQKTTWWGRNWFWAVPLGCLGMCSLPVILVAGLFGLIFGSVTTSEPYVEALKMARVHPEVIDELGPRKPPLGYAGPGLPLCAQR